MMPLASPEPREISAAEAGERLQAGQEVAFLDVREAGQFGEGHPLFAVPAPWSELELRIGALVPRRSVPVMLLDGGDGIAPRAAKRLGHLGYTDVRVIAGGIAAWQAAGLGVFKGVHVPSKVLGELAEQVWHPPMLSPENLADWQQQGRTFQLFDARPPVEYEKMRVPGAECLPNGELAHRIAAVVKTKNQPLVITCAGRTRGITGVIGLLAAGHHGEVYALENGTQGWALAGNQLERGNAARPYPDLDQGAFAESVLAADRLMARFAIPAVMADRLPALLADQNRTTYLLDTRSDDEVRADPVSGTCHAPCGQLVQATDLWVGVRNARVVLCCDSGLRSALAAFWLRQLGYEALVLRIDNRLRQTDLPLSPRIEVPPIERISALAALAQMHRSHRDGMLPLLLDLRGSMAYRKRHVAGATWAIRPLLNRLMDRARRASQVFLVSDNAAVASLLAEDLRFAGVAQVRLIEGGLAAMTKAGAALESSAALPDDETAVDHLFFVHDRHDGNLDASRRYLAWETGLVAQLSELERAAFHVRGPGHQS